MKISVVIPVYNKVEYIAKCLEHILQQDFEDFEIICVDDGSTDNSGAICDEWAQKDLRVRVIHTENGGVTAARRKGVEAAQGSYIIFVDADDLLLPGALTTLYKAISDADADEVIARFRTQDNVYSPVVYEGLVEDVTPLIKAIATNKNRFPVLWAILFRKTVLEGCLDTPREIIEGEDLLMQMKVLMKRPKVFFIKDCVYAYTLGVPNSRRHTLTLIKAFDTELRKTLQPRWKEMESSFILHQLKEYARCLTEKQYTVRKQYYQDAITTIPNDIPFLLRIVWYTPAPLGRAIYSLYRRLITIMHKGL